MSEEKKRKKIFDSMCKLDQARVLRYEGITGRVLNSENLTNWKNYFDDERKAREALDKFNLGGSLRMIYLNYARCLHHAKRIQGGLALKKVIEAKKTYYKAMGCKEKILDTLTKVIIKEKLP